MLRRDGVYDKMSAMETNESSRPSRWDLVPEEVFDLANGMYIYRDGKYIPWIYKPPTTTTDECMPDVLDVDRLAQLGIDDDPECLPDRSPASSSSNDQGGVSPMVVDDSSADRSVPAMTTEPENTRNEDANRGNQLEGYGTYADEMDVYDDSLDMWTDSDDSELEDVTVEEDDDNETGPYVYVMVSDLVCVRSDLTWKFGLFANTCQYYYQVDGARGRKQKRAPHNNNPLPSTLSNDAADTEVETPALTMGESPEDSPGSSVKGFDSSLSTMSPDEIIRRSLVNTSSGKFPSFPSCSAEQARYIPRSGSHHFSHVSELL